MNLLVYLQEKQTEMLSVLQTMVEYESPSDNKQAIDCLVNYLYDWSVNRGFNAQILEQQERGNHLKVTIGPAEAKEKRLILCHIDTVWPLGTINELPFKIVDDRMTGPGVFDMKCGAMQALFALETIQKHQLAKDKQITILFNSDEEIGSPTSRPIIEDLARQSQYVFVLEPSVPPQGALKTFRKGVGQFKLEIIGKASHAGSAPEKGISAITELAHQILHLESLANPSKGTTVNVGVVTGGSKSNVVSAQASAEIDVRVKTLEEAQRIEQDMLQAKTFTPGAQVKISGGLNRPPMIRTEKTIQVFQHAQQLAKELGFNIEEASTGGGSDGNFTAALGIPTVDGLGAVGAGGHARNEHAFKSHIIPRTALLVRLLQTL